jgi:NAD(P)-dependent dehydrogenase (short-subunit alcohol dehydrogenase family)
VDHTNSLSGKIAVITGAGRGIGRAAAELFAHAGAHVVIAARSSDELNDTSGQIIARGGKCLPIRTDLTSEDAIVKLFETTNKLLGSVDILVNNAGSFSIAPVRDMTAKAWDQVFAVNVRAMFLCCREAFKTMSANGGSIINVSSLGGLRGYEKFPGLSSYTASKFAVSGFTEALAVEGREFGIRVNAIAPGAVDTKMLRDAAPHLKTNTAPIDIAEIMLYLADSARSGAVNGNIIEVNSNL